MEANRNFANKLWNAGRYLIGNLKALPEAERAALAVAGRWSEDDIQVHTWCVCVCLFVFLNIYVNQCVDGCVCVYIKASCVCARGCGCNAAPVAERADVYVIC